MGSIVSGIGNLGEGVSDLFLGDYQETAKNLSNDSLYSITTPGSSLIPSGKQWTLTRSPELQNTISGLSGAYMDASNEFGDLKGVVEPGFGRLTEAGVRAIRDARRSELSDLRKNLSRRRVLGSSFAQDDRNRTMAEWQKREDQFRTQAFIQEMQMKEQLIAKQYEAAANSFLQLLNQFNFESGIATQLASNVTSVLGANAQTAAKIQAEFGLGAAGELAKMAGSAASTLGTMFLA